MLAAGGWLVYAQWWGQGAGRAVAYEDLTPQFGRVEFTRRVTAVYHSPQPFARLLAATIPGRAPDVPALDWSRRQVVVISLGPRSSTGYDLRVRRIVERRRGIYVYAREQTPSLGDPVEARVTYPFRVLAMPATQKPVYVKLQGRP